MPRPLENILPVKWFCVPLSVYVKISLVVVYLFVSYTAYFHFLSKLHTIETSLAAEACFSLIQSLFILAAIPILSFDFFSVVTTPEWHKNVLISQKESQELKLSLGMVIEQRCKIGLSQSFSHVFGLQFFYSFDEIAFF